MRQMRWVGSLVCAALAVSGCAALLVGAGAAGGYAISKDSVTNHFDLPMSQVFRASREVVKEMGLITLEDEQHGLIKATIEGANVKITVKSVSAKTVQLKVRARNDLLLPKLEVANTVYNRIFDRLQ
jgi:hypothetical protein